MRFSAIWFALCASLLASARPVYRRSSTACMVDADCEKTYVSEDRNHNHTVRYTFAYFPYLSKCPTCLDSGVSAAVCQNNQCQLTCRGSWTLQDGRCVDQWNNINTCGVPNTTATDDGCNCFGDFIASPVATCACPEGKTFMASPDRKYVCA